MHFSISLKGPLEKDPQVDIFSASASTSGEFQYDYGTSMSPLYLRCIHRMFNQKTRIDFTVKHPHSNEFPLDLGEILKSCNWFQVLIKTLQRHPFDWFSLHFPSFSPSSHPTLLLGAPLPFPPCRCHCWTSRPAAECSTWIWTSWPGKIHPGCWRTSSQAGDGGGYGPENPPDLMMAGCHVNHGLPSGYVKIAIENGHL